MKIILAVCILSLVAACGDDEPNKDIGWSSYPDYGPNPYVDKGPTYPDFGPNPYLDTGGTACNATSCGSGCCQGNQCMSGASNSACGYGGLPCKLCLAGESCKAGACSTTNCDSSSCSSGCCDQGKCVSGTSDTACGSGGKQCSQCKSTEQCNSGTCKSKGPISYKVTLVSAKVTGCGMGDTCDAFVQLKVGSASAKSSTKANTESPIWNEYMLTATETDLKKSFAVEVFDEDTIWDDSIGKCTPTITASILTAGKLVTTCGTVKSLTFEFK